MKYVNYISVKLYTHTHTHTRFATLGCLGLKVRARLSCLGQSMRVFYSVPASGDPCCHGPSRPAPEVLSDG